MLSSERKVVGAAIVGAAAAVLVAKIVIRQHRSKVACGCLFHCTCAEKKKCSATSATSATSIAAEPTMATSAPTTKEAPVEVCCSVVPEPSAEVEVLEEVLAQKQPPRSPTAAGKQRPE